MNVRKPIIENPVYCEIIFRLGVNKYHVNKFVNHFTEEDILDLEHDPKPYKKQPVLQRQMRDLEKEGFLLSEKKKNTILFYVNFEKIIETYIDYSLAKKKEESQSSKDPLTGESFKKIKTLFESKEYREKCKKNRLIRYAFSAFIEEVRRSNIDSRYVTLKDLFDSIRSTGYIQDRIKGYMGEAGFINKGYEKEFDIFIGFIGHSRIAYLQEFANRILAIEISNILVKGFSPRDISFYRLK